MENKTKVGAPKKYADRITISHSIENDLLAAINKVTDYGLTRTDFINNAIRTAIKNKK